MKKLLAVGLAAAAALAFAAPASAKSSGDTYYMSKAQAERNTRDAAETLYGDTYGITYADSGAFCRPQGARRAKRGYVYHRWVCTWAADDYEGEMAFGVLRVTGHSGDSYGYKVLRGIHWR